MQGIGLVGRDRKEAVALLLHNSYHLRNTDPGVDDFYKSKTVDEF